MASDEQTTCQCSNCGNEADLTLTCERAQEEPAEPAEWDLTCEYCGNESELTLLLAESKRP